MPTTSPRHVDQGGRSPSGAQGTRIRASLPTARLLLPRPVMHLLAAVFVITSSVDQKVWVEPVDKADAEPTICWTPCRLEVAPGRYRYGTSGSESGLRSYSSTISVPETGAELRLRAAKKSGHAWGLALVGVGVGFLSYGAFFSALPLLSNPNDS